MIDFRGTFAQGAARWKTLTQAQRDQWTQFAIDHPKVDSLGRPQILTGISAFVAVWQNREQGGFGQWDEPEAITPDQNFLLGATNIDTSPLVEINWTGDLVNTEDSMQIFMTRGMSAGAKPQNSDFKLVTNTLAGDISPATATSLYTARFGNPVAGLYVWTKALYLCKSAWPIGGAQITKALVGT